MWKERAGRGVRPKMSVGSTMEAIQKRGKLVVGTKMDQPLFGLKGFSGKPEGFDVEIAKKVAWSILATRTRWNSWRRSRRTVSRSSRRARSTS